MSAQLSSQHKKKSKASRGVRYERADGCDYVGHAAALRLIAAGIAVRDESRAGFAIRQRFKTCNPTGKRFVVRESWGDSFRAFALINPETNRKVASVHEGERRPGLGVAAWAQGDRA